MLNYYVITPAKLFGDIAFTLVRRLIFFVSIITDTFTALTNCGGKAAIWAFGISAAAILFFMFMSFVMVALLTAFALNPLLIWGSLGLLVSGVNTIKNDLLNRSPASC